MSTLLSTVRGEVVNLQHQQLGELESINPVILIATASAALQVRILRIGHRRWVPRGHHKGIDHAGCPRGRTSGRAMAASAPRADLQGLTWCTVLLDFLRATTLGDGEHAGICNEPGWSGRRLAQDPRRASS